MFELSWEEKYAPYIPSASGVDLIDAPCTHARNDSVELNQLNVIVTGAASGLGRCFAEQLIAAGANVLAADLNEDALSELSIDGPGKLATFAVDVSKEDEVIAMVQAGVDAFGSISGLINNAGIFRDAMLVSRDKKTGDIRKMSLSQWQTVIDVDLTGPFLCTREVVAQMVENDVKGVIVNISSVSRHGNRGQSNYSAAKAGLIADTKLWAEELARYGVRTGAVAPGFTRTPILEAMRPEVLDKIASGIPLRKLGEPEHIWQAVKFIFECDYFTGRCIDVDGGLSL